VRQAEADSGKRTELLSTQEREEIRRLRKENLRAAPRQRDPQVGVAVFRARARPNRPK
jgi:hypothetical protein